MFGYVNVNKNDLTPEQAERYHSYYCGLCRSLHKQYGFTGQVTLSYDMVFLSMLLSSLYEPLEQTGTDACIPHPVKKHTWVGNEFVDYCADMTIALSYYKLLDDWKDDHSYVSLSASKMLQSRHLAVAKKYPMQCAAIHNRLCCLSQLERENCHDLDRVSNCFGEMLAAIFDVKKDMWSVPLQQMGYALGKFIYLMDAYEDLESDIQKCRYNPLLGIAGKPGYEEHCHDILTMLMSQCAEAYEKLPCIQDAAILRNVLYSGVWTRYHMLQTKPRKKEKNRFGGKKTVQEPLPDPSVKEPESDE